MNSVKDKKVIITGATGFLGSRMVAFLKEKNYFIKGIGKKSKSNIYRERWYREADLLEQIDLRDFKKTLKALDGFDLVYHFAADMGGVGYFSGAQYIPFINNIRMDINIIEASQKAGVKRIFYPSSVCAYPIDLQSKEGEPPKLRENMLVPANADQMYGWEKFIMILLEKYSPIDLRIGILNTIFGEGQEGVGPRSKFPPSIVSKVIDAKKNNKPIEIWGNGKQIRTFLYIEDALEKIYEVMMNDKYSGPVNIAADEIVTVQQCANWLSEFAKIKPIYKYLDSKPSGVLARAIDNSKFYKNYKYINKFTTKEGFKRLYEFMLKHGTH